MKQIKSLFILGMPMLFYCIPLLLGYSWNTIATDPGSFNSAFSNPNLFTNPSSYTGRHPDGPISIDLQTPYTYGLAYDSSLRRYIKNGQLPLWDPERGLGVPFLAQGQGGTFFPLQILRAVVPYKYANYINVISLYFAAIFMFLFLRDIGVSEIAAYIGSFSFVLSGAFGAQMIATDIVFSLSVVPFLFWSVAKAIRYQTTFWRSLLSVSVATQILAGHIIMAFVILLSTIIFSLFYIRLNVSRFSRFVKHSFIIFLYVIFGVGLSLFSVLPIIESLMVAHNTAHEKLGFYFMPISHLLAVVNPLIWGPIQNGWFYINWYDLFAFSGVSIVVAVLGGFTASGWDKPLHRSIFWFFVTIALFWILRYIGFPGLKWVGLLPLFSELCTKHANGFTVFCLCVAAAFAIDQIEKWRLSYFSFIVGILFVASCLGFLLDLGSKGFPNIEAGVPYIAISILLYFFTTAVFVFARLMSKDDALKLLLIAIPAELIIYIPLGNSSLAFLYIRIVLYVFIILTAILLKKIPYRLIKYRYAIAGVMVAIFVFVYTLLIHIPNHGLPHHWDLTIPPKQLGWLKANMSIGDRSFGIRPNNQVLAGIQNIDSTGPFQPRGFANFVRLIDGDWAGFKNGDFNVHREYNMIKYLQYRAFFDWVGVKYLFLEKNEVVKGTTGYNELTDAKNHLKIVYQDNAVTIVESQTSLNRAYFSSSYRLCQTGPETTKSIIQFFRKYPNYISKTTFVEQANIQYASKDVLFATDSLSDQLPVEILRYEPNYVQLSVKAPFSGILVLKDAFYPGWQALINKREVPILRTNAMVRGVRIDSPGKYVVEFRYLPKSFVWGVMVAGTVSILLIISVLVCWYRHSHQAGIICKEA